MDFYNTHTFAMSTLFIFFFSVVNQWTGVEGWSYHYSDTTMPWVEAREWCKENYTDMVAIQNRDEIEYLNTVIPKATTGYYWIGIRKINGIWTWVGTNKHLTAEAENWAKGEPNNGGNNEDCVEMYIKRGTDDGKWNDEHCQKKKSALCYTASCKKDSCSPNGECVETINSHQCECFEGFYGKKCEHVVICEEKYISAPENGGVQCSHAFGNFSYKSECKYSCNEGYKLVGAKVTECGATKAWSNTPPTCELVQCPGIETPQDGSVSCTDQILSLGSVCSFNCSEGFILEGASSTKCTKMGDWSANVPKCTAVRCPNLEEPLEGKMRCSGDSYGNQCMFSCNNGYQLLGVSELTCTKTAQWSQVTPSCTAVQCSGLETPQNGSMSCTDETLSLGSVCSFNCSEGFILEGASSTECTKEGKWSADVPKCTAVQCPGLKTPQDGSVSCTDQTLSLGSVCSFSCSEGFILEGASSTECTKTGDWSANVPKCTAVQCPVIETPQDGSVSCTDQTLRLGSVCSFNCSEGFILEGASSTECTKTGDWSADLPKCTAVQCIGLKTPQDGSVSCTDQTLSLGSVCSFNCSDGFILEGASSTECTKTGEWNADVPKCTAVRCPYLQELINGLMNCSSEENLYSTACSFSCLNGYELQGHQIVMCSLSGNWTGEVPECKEVQPEHSLSSVSGVTIGVGITAALSSLGFAFWIMKRLRKLKAKTFDLSNSDIDVPPQQYKSFDSLI